MNIHIWNTKAVARDLVGGRVSEIDACGYLLALSLLFAADHYLAVFVVPPIDWMLLYEFIVVVTVTLVGLRACFLANGGRNGKDFILRFTCISLPINIKLALFGWAFVFVNYRYPELVIDSMTFADPERAWMVLTMFWLAAFTSIFYWRVWHHLKLLHDVQQGVPGDVAASRRRA